MLRAPESSCGSAHRWPWVLWVRGEEQCLSVVCVVIDSEITGMLLCWALSLQVPVLVLALQVLMPVSEWGHMRRGKAVASASRELLLTAEKLDTEHSKKVTARLNKRLSCFCSLKNCSFFGCRFSKNQWLIQAVSQKEKWGWSLLTGRNSSCQIRSYWSEYLPAVLHFPFCYSVVPFPRKFSGFTVNVLSLLIISCACLHSEQLNAVRQLQKELQ